VLDADGIAQLVEKFFGLGEAGSGKVVLPQNKSLLL
jgi:hypothetical protein